MPRPTPKKVLSPKYRGLVVILCFIVTGLLALIITHAAQTNQSIQPESGTPNGLAVCANTTGTSGSCVQFGGVGGGSLSAPITALTVVATDNVVGNAICIDNSANVSSMSAKVTACMQINPTNNTMARFGTYDLVNKQFTPVSNSTWTAIANHASALQNTSLVCSGTSHSALGLGPLNGNYYGEELTGTTINFGTIGVATPHICNTSGGGTLNNLAASALPTALITCSAGATKVTTIAELDAAVNGSASEICVAGGHYSLDHTLKLKANVKLIGDPIDRAVLDAGSLNGVGGASTSVINIGGASATVANIVATGTHIKCSQGLNCGDGIDAGAGWHLYNDKISGNEETGFHSVSVGYLVENSEISGNGTARLLSQTTGGTKTISAGTYKNDVSINNIGDGLWCDGASKQVCSGGTWTVVDNYLAYNSKAGAHYEIAFNNAADIENNVVIGNNKGVDATHTPSAYSGGISIYATNVTIKNNIVRGNHIHGILVYTDFHRSPPDPPSSNDTVINNIVANDNDIFCTARGNGANIICSPNTRVP